MRILIIGSGAREHTIAWKLHESSKVDQIFTAPGNAGTSLVGANLPIAPYDTDMLIRAVHRYNIDLTVVGPEVPLANGIVDRFHQEDLAIFGPTKEAALLESSKVFSRNLMQKQSIPSPDYKIFNSYSDGYKFLSNHEGAVVVKANGLASGKGAIVCRDQEAAINALYDCMEDRVFGASGDSVVIEELLEGEEISVFAFTDGSHVASLVTACDYKRLLEGNRGPNTGGMGSYSPYHGWSKGLARQVNKEILIPTIKAMAQSGAPYTGMLYAGLMLTSEGPKVLEFNCRLGDPETQVILPSMKTDLLDVMMSTINGNLKDTSVDWGSSTSVGVVMASRGYPGQYRKGLEIHGMDLLDSDALVFHGGTSRMANDQSRLMVTGGRVLTVVGKGPNLETARDHAYGNISQISFEGSHYRKDIGLLSNTSTEGMRK